MIAPPVPQSGKAGLMMIEGALTLVVAVVAFGWPEVGSKFFCTVERAFGRLARKKGLAVAVVGLTALLLRLAILPVCPVPKPFAPDDFSNLLAADTFAAGRLSNPTPEMWSHFESIHITMQPTYGSMYFAGEGLVLAASKVVTGHPWFGLLGMSALMCAAICWMLQAWLPPGWALLGGMLAVVRIGLFSYWINTYTGAGLISALGGALILGALPRFLRAPRLRYSVLLATGTILLANTRPYEGVLLCLPVAAALGHWLLFGKNRPNPAALLRLSAAPVLLMVAAAGWMGYYNYRAFGSPLTLPYTINRATYAIAPYFVWQSPRPEPAYRHTAMRSFYYEGEFAAFRNVNEHFIKETSIKLLEVILFFSGFALFPGLLTSWRVLKDRRTRFLVQCMAVMMAGMMVQIFLVIHYLAPFTTVFYALGLQGIRHLRFATVDRKRVGLAIARWSVALCVILAGVRLLAGPLRIDMPEWPASKWNCQWYGPRNFGKDRARIVASLEQLPGRHLVIVRYSADHYPFDEWVYNGADIDGSRVIWARDMEAAANLELIHYYQDRQVWLVEPDQPSPVLSTYPVREQEAKSNIENPTRLAGMQSLPSQKLIP